MKYAQALDRLAAGEALTRKSWCGGYVRLAPINGVDTIARFDSDGSPASRFSPDAEDLLADDWIFAARHLGVASRSGADGCAAAVTGPIERRTIAVMLRSVADRLEEEGKERERVEHTLAVLAAEMGVTSHDLHKQAAEIEKIDQAHASQRQHLRAGLFRRWPRAVNEEERRPSDS